MMMQRKAFTSASRASASRASTVRVCAQQNGEVAVQKTALASVAAAAMLMAAAPVHAGVVLQQPQLKNALVVEDNAAPAAPAPKKTLILPKDRKNAPAPQAASAPAPKAAPAAAPSFSAGGDIDAKSIALPASLAVLAGGAFALTKLDEGFADFMDTASVKDSGDIGAGYETALKAGGPIGGKGTQKRGTQGTKRVKAATKSASTSPLGSLFGTKDE